MGIKVLWPAIRWPPPYEIEREALGEGVEGEFCSGFEAVTEEQWAGCDGVVCGMDIPSRYVEKMKRCRIFVKRTVGVDNIDLKRWGRLGVPVCNNPDYGTREVADHAIALMLALTRGLLFQDRRLHEDPVGNWAPALNPFGRRLSTCTFGVVGLGRIGTAAALRARAFEMQVLFYDPYREEGVEGSLQIGRVRTLAELMARCEVVSVHTPLTAETLGMLDRPAFQAARPGLILINTARGAVVDLGALYEAMREGVVLAAGLDVLPREPADVEEPLIGAWHRREAWLRDRLLLTPHSAFYTPESLRDMRAFAARTAARYLRDGRLEHCVNQAELRFRR